MPSLPPVSPAPALATDLAPALHDQLAALGTPSRLHAAPVRITEDAIRHWCAAFEDGHRPCLDDAFARRLGHRGLIAPLGSVLSTFVLPYLWPPPAPAATPLRNLHHDVREILGFPAGVIARVAVDQLSSLCVGDRVAVSQRLVSVSTRKQTALGTGRFWVIERSYHRDGGELAVRETMTSCGFDPATRTAPQANDTAPAGVNDESVPAAQLPELCMPITTLRSVSVASASRDFSPFHVDPEYARRVAGAPSAFMSREFHIGIVSRFLTDWGGEDSSVRRIDLALRRNLCVGDEMTVRGHVTATHEREEGHDVEVAVAIRAPHGVVSAGVAVVALAAPIP
jgi:acyl dehydratase